LSFTVYLKVYISNWETPIQLQKLVGIFRVLLAKLGQEKRFIRKMGLITGKGWKCKSLG